MRTSQCGVTLIELVVTVAILAVIAALAAPSFAEFTDRARVRGAADGVASLINQARQDAVKHGRDVSLTMKGTTAAWCLGANEAVIATVGNRAPSAVACDCSDDDPACLVSGRTAEIASSDFGSPAADGVDFSLMIDGRRGTTSGLAGDSVVLTSPAGTYDLRVTVTALGHARVCVPAGKPAVQSLPAC